MVRVSLKNILRCFADGTRVGPIDLEVRDGELLSLLGPSGSGKTTTLRIIAGFINPDQGMIEFDDINILPLSPGDRRIGMVFQSIALFPNMTVFQNIAFGPEMSNWSRSDVIQRVEELADLLGIRELLHRRINEISGGEAQRVALARALAKKPDLLLLDEPLSALDPHLRERLQKEIRRIQQELGITTIYVTHNQAEAFAISDRIAVLNDGEILQVSTPAELYDTPRTPFVATFIGNGNLLKVEVKAVSGNEYIAIVDNQTMQFDSDISPGAIVFLTAKPEDVHIYLTERNNTLRGIITSVTPTVGGHTVELTIGSISLTALLSDDELVQQLSDGDHIYVGFDSLRIIPFT